MKKHLLHASLLFSLTVTIDGSSAGAAENKPPASPEVTAAMQPYLDSYKLAGFVAIIADKTGKVHYKNVHGYADVEAKKPISEDNVFWIASMTKMFDVRRRVDHDAGRRRQGEPGRSRHQVHPAA